jgi:hypothetical protein
MPKPEDNLISYLAALKHLRDTEERLGIEPLQLREDCPQPTELMEVAEGTASRERVERIDQHLRECASCQAALQAFRSALADESLPDLPDDFKDPVGEWVSSDEALLPTEYAGNAHTATAVPADTASAGDWAAIGGTRLAQSPHSADHVRLLDFLRHWVPVLQRKLELPAFDVEAFLVSVRKRLPLPAGERFRDHLSRWLADRSGRPVGSIVITPELVAAAAVGVAASRPGPNESSWARDVRTFVLEQHLATPDDILGLAVPEPLRTSPALRAYKRDLHREARRAQHDGMLLFEYAQSA